MKKLISLFLAMYMLVLNIGPAFALGGSSSVFSMSCCEEESKQSSDCCSSNGKHSSNDCKQGDCNPFMTHCAGCAIVAICPASEITLSTVLSSYTHPKYIDFVAQLNDQFVYSCLHPPEVPVVLYI